METLNQQACFGGIQASYRHDAKTIGLPMRFSVYQPPQAQREPVPALFFLAGLTCNEETFMIKAGAQRAAAEAGIMLIAPDTSPRQTGIEGVSAHWDFGDGAGFYLDATEAPWSRHFKMESYLTEELYPLIVQRFAVRAESIGIFGHSMGGHGALTLALRHLQLFRSVSAFAPIAAPMHCPWGEKAFTQYLGADRARWSEHDASALMARSRAPFPRGILIDQGLADQFLPNQLMPERFEEACRVAAQPLTLRRHPGYEHGYYFVSSFMADHLAFHRDCLAT
ncbi:MAG: S-formylglutathione hydrolase [Pseudomonadota bacterium]|nr:S-formylglutathione hydrolase [Pseudomonadota bacterium]